MKVDKEKFLQDFQLRSFGAKGWKNSKFISCPHCGKDYTKFGVLLLDNGGIYRCFRCSMKGSIYKLLKLLDRKDLILFDNEDNFSYQEKLEGLLEVTKTDSLDLDLPTISLPFGSKRIFENDYLTSRGWSQSDFYKTEVYINDTFSRYINKLIFPLREDNNIVAYLSRSIYSKEWHKENLRLFKEGTEKLVLRYDNSDSNFEKIVGGVDDVIEGQTNTVIIVEGLFDKKNVDRVLGLDEGDQVKCVFTFGCHLSSVQLYKLYLRGVKNIILMFDAETIQETKTVSLNLSNYFNIFIAETRGDKDPGEMNLPDFEKSLSSLKNPIDFFVNKIENIVLK